MIRAALILALLLLPAATEAGHRRTLRRTNQDVRVVRLQLRVARANSGRPVAWVFYYSARTAANVSGLLNPVSWFLGL